MTRSIEIDNLEIPPLAGLCDYDEAAQPGLSVEATVGFLKRFAYVTGRLTKLLAAHLPRTPEWEVKCALGLHLWLDAEHASMLRKRVAEMRQPPLGLDKVPDTRLEGWLDEAIRPEETVELVAGVYRVIRPELIRSIDRFLAASNPLLDYPTRRIFRLIRQEEEEMIAWGERALTALTRSTEASVRANAWIAHLDAYRGASTGVFADELAPSARPLPGSRSDGQPYQMDAAPRRDERFIDPFNRAAAFGAHYKDESRPLTERVMALMAKRLMEMDVPEWMAPIVVRTEGKPWDYYVEMSRQLWDEVRHAMMGEVGFVRQGIPFYRYPVNLAASHTLNADFTPMEAHAILWAIEQSLMARNTGKGYEWDLAVASGDDFATSMQDFDWADEVLHAQIGRRWLIPEVGSQAKLRDYAAGVVERWVRALEATAAASPQEDWWPRLQADIEEREARSEE
ncbi:MAG: hypothetical protein ACRDJH_22330 [Thermomicrobiales bacterium]